MAARNQWNYLNYGDVFRARRGSNPNVGNPGPYSDGYGYIQGRPAIGNSPYGPNAFGDPNFLNPLAANLGQTSPELIEPRMGSIFGNVGPYAGKYGTSSAPTVPNRTLQTISGVSNTPDITDPGATTGSGSGSGLSGAQKFGIAGGTQALGGIYNLIQLGRQKRKFEKAGIQDIVPQATKDALGEATLRANSTRASNYSQQLDNIRSNENTAIGNAQLAATSPDQIQRAAIAAQKNSNRAVLNLGEMGVQSQRQNRAQKTALQGTVAGYQDQARRNYEQGLASFYNAKQQQIGNMINGVAGSALLAL